MDTCFLQHKENLEEYARRFSAPLTKPREMHRAFSMEKEMIPVFFNSMNILCPASSLKLDKPRGRQKAGA